MKWDNYFMEIAEKVSEKSACLSRKVGAIVVKDNAIICEGFNGPARHMPHCGAERLKYDYTMRHRIENEAFEPVHGDDNSCPRKRLGFASGQGLEYCPAAHAETNCIAHAARFGICLKNSTMYITSCMPCKNCMAIIINAGITEIVVEDIRYDSDLRYLDEFIKKYVQIRIYNREGGK